MYITESIQTPVNSTYDIAVCGGGFAGIAAALASARQGKRTILFERQFMLGGLGTAGIVTIYLPICDGMGHQISYGIAEELLRLSVSRGAEDRYPANWLDGIGGRTEKDKRFEAQYNPQLFAILAEKLLIDAGVDILYGSYAVGVSKEDDRITHVIVENKSGRCAYSIQSVVDATGDCDIALFAGAPTETFGQGNVLAAWYYAVGKNGYKLHMHGFCDVPEEEKSEENRVPLLESKRYTGLDAGEISDFIISSHASAFNHIMQERREDPTLLPVTMATIPQLRMTRRIVGEYTLSDKEERTSFADSIGMIPNWKRRGPIYEVPFSTLYSRTVRNLICAGRCISVTDTMWDIMRVIPCCAVTGQAAGTAAAMIADGSTDFTTLDVSALQRRLASDRVRLHLEEVFS
ncbi:MAG: FAD-dependent oxidoreductase [Clostridia bacterium]|nr:FAD-dependent oxidoreductase [Clostridia bacterium]